ncbi:MAG: hypothetical protein COY46_02900 [Chloroflexi bacterium CG_4_10_14_0_8_um_filter_46_9]|nr:MAG: hypothetical protein AUK39_05515 [Dehalococcoidia bacterium CG2_30_46_19]PIZ26860.1 MAG: hypothetical protein COY46_02900 [Chloroflexi bacterium CG_4_10_14_0_8_um_filter_46_9]
MNQATIFKESLKKILTIGIEHSDKHQEDLKRLAVEARLKDSEELNQGLLQAAELAEALASKLKEIAEKIG